MGEALQRAALSCLWPQPRHGGPDRAVPQHLRAGRQLERRKGKSAGRRLPQGCHGPSGGEVEIWGDGKQTRSFLYIDQCVEGTLRLMRSKFTGPVNIGSDEMVTIDALVDIVAQIAGKTVKKRHVPGPTGVRGRNSDNRLIREKLGWAPSTKLVDGLRPTYEWIEGQVMRNARTANEALPRQSVAVAAKVAQTAK